MVVGEGSAAGKTERGAAEVLVEVPGQGEFLGLGEMVGVEEAGERGV